MTAMKIGIDCHNLEGQRTGVGRYIWNLLKKWLTNPMVGGVEFNLYFKNEIPQDIEELSYADDRAQKVAVRSLRAKSNALFKHFYLPRAAKQDKADVLFCPDYVLPFYVGSLTRHIKTAVAIHDIIYEARPNEYSWPSRSDKILLKWASKQSAKKADIIFVPSEFTKDEVLKYYDVDPRKVIITPLAPDPIFQRIMLDKPTGSGPVGFNVEKKYGITGKFIFFIGSIFNRRFLPEKIQGFSEFAKDHTDFQFFIVGNNRTRPFQDIEALVDEANERLGKNAVIWEKYLPDDTDLVLLYNRAYAVIWLSSYEGFGLPVLESMACGTPVITSRHGSLPEVAGSAACYVGHPENPDEIAEALTRIADDPTYYRELVEAGYAQAQRFSWQKTAYETLRFLNTSHRA